MKYLLQLEIKLKNVVKKIKTILKHDKKLNKNYKAKNQKIQI